MLPNLIAITHVSDVLFYLLNIYLVYIHTNFWKHISTVIKFYFRLHRWISLYHFMYVYIAWQNSLQSNTHIVFKYFIFHCTCKVPLFSFLKKNLAFNNPLMCQNFLKKRWKPDFSGKRWFQDIVSRLSYDYGRSPINNKWNRHV